MAVDSKEPRQQWKEPKSWSDERKKRVEQYANVRPAASRGAKFGVTAALLSKVYSMGDKAGKAAPVVRSAASGGKLSKFLRSARSRTTLPALVVPAAIAAGVADQRLEAAAQKEKKLAKKFEQKLGGIDISNDSEAPLRQRHTAATLSEGAEHSNVAVTNAMLEELFSHKDEMARRCEKQLKGLFKSPSYGRNRGLGLSAAEASKLVTRAFSGKE